MSTTDGASPELLIRPPAQRRSREAWLRVLNAGVELLEEEGYEAFTIAAVCGRARVAPRAIYARAANKDALYLAVYEHAMARIAVGHAVFTDAQRWKRCTPTELVRGAVTELANLFFSYAPLLRSVARTSGMHPEVLRRGSEYTHQLGELFVALLLDRPEVVDAVDPASATWRCFNVAFATLTMRIANGPGFAARAVDDQTFVAELADLACRYLCG